MCSETPLLQFLDQRVVEHWLLSFGRACIGKVDLAQFLGLNISLQSLISGLVVRLGYVRHRNQLTAKAWEKAAQELGKISSSTVMM